LRTLVISDLHVGAGHGRSRLQDDQVFAALAEAIPEYNRIVLLGDVIELRQSPMRDALAAASRVLPRLVAGLEPRHELVLVAGNHDHELLAPWVVRRGASAPPPPLSLETVVDWNAGEPLAAVVAMLAGSGARVRVAYPGVWLRPDVYALHGHYLDAHTTAPGFERVFAGAVAKFIRTPTKDLRSVDDYERVLAPIYAWMLAITERGGPELDGADGEGSVRILRMLNQGGPRSQALHLGISAAAKALQLAGLGELSGEVRGDALYRADLRGLGTALANLGVSAEHVIFGHTHRAGPLPGEDRGPWRSATGIRLTNTGCWVHEGQAFMRAEEQSTSPYRPGFAVELDDEGPPRLVNLLDR